MILEIALGIVLAVVILATVRIWLPLLSGVVLLVVGIVGLLIIWALLA